MKFLLCTPQPISHYLGISRVLIDLKNELESSGHEVDFVGPLEIGMKNTNFASLEFRNQYTAKLKDYLIENANQYDVVDYDHEFLPFNRNIFSKKPLFVARTVLLVQHILSIKPKKPWSFRSLVGQWLRRKHFSIRLNESWITLCQADLINVPNTHDKKLLVSLGINSEKICVIPFGLSKERVEHFSNTDSSSPKDNKICFLGSFDYRKGAAHFGSIFREVRKINPQTKLLLLGCGGLFSNREKVLNFFDKIDHDHIETVFKFDRERVGDYLKDCSLGIYPSYMEGFPFGILEMLMAYLPVIAFDAPGASMMLPADHLVPVGDEISMASLINGLIDNRITLDLKRLEAHANASRFTWKYVVDKTLECYEAKL